MSMQHLWRRIQQVVGRGRSTDANDAGPVQTMQVRMGADELIGDLPRAAEYGFTSVPPVGTDAIVLFLGGERSNGIVVATNNQQFRMKALGNGDVAIYDNRGQSVLLSADGIVIDAGGSRPITLQNATRVDVNSPLHANQGLHIDGVIEQTSADPVTLGGPVTSAGEISAPDVKLGGLSVKTHRHISASSGNPTGQPIA